MKNIFATLIFTCGILISFAQVTPANLTGYWLEKESPDKISLSTLLVFSLDESGEMEGSVYFMDSDDSEREFKLSNIKIGDVEISFNIGNTTISFLGQMDHDTAMFSGVFYLDDGVRVEVKHQKLDDQTVNRLEAGRRFIPKKHIDHTDGVLTG